MLHFPLIETSFTLDSKLRPFRSSTIINKKLNVFLPLLLLDLLLYVKFYSENNKWFSLEKLISVQKYPSSKL